MAKAAAQPKYTPQMNLAARNLILATAIDCWQQTFKTTSTQGAGAVINIPLRNVGLLKRIVVEVSATVSGTNSGPTHTLTSLGLANFFSNVVLTDLSNQQRINTSGWHLTYLASAKNRAPYAGAINNSAQDTPFGFGANYTKVQSAPSTISAAVASDNVFGMFEIPVAYADNDLRGAIYANVVNATFNLQLTVNPNFAVVSTADGTLAVYKSDSTTVAATVPSFTIKLYQNYLDQLPQSTGGAILPLIDISTAYLLNNTAYSGIVVNQDNPLPYPNFRDIMSTFVIYDNNGTLNAGTDVNYFQLQTANYTNIWNIDPKIASYWSRLRMQDDFPAGMYYFDHRNRPISTVQYGNMALVINPSSVGGAGSSFLVGYEMLALINQITQAGSISGT